MKTSLPQAFWDRVEKIAGASGCWIWLGGGCSNDADYGLWRRRVVHRLLWEITNETVIQHGLFACNKCDVKPCCNPDHIFIGTAQDNVVDAQKKGRMGPNTKQFTCLRCNRTWQPRLRSPKQCRWCKSRGWYAPAGAIKRGRPRKRSNHAPDLRCRSAVPPESPATEAGPRGGQ